MTRKATQADELAAWFVQEYRHESFSFQNKAHTRQIRFARMALVGHTPAVVKLALKLRAREGAPGDIFECKFSRRGQTFLELASTVPPPPREEQVSEWLAYIDTWLNVAAELGNPLSIPPSIIPYILKAHSHDTKRETTERGDEGGRRDGTKARSYAAQRARLHRAADTRWH